jgi:hypothetical protein
VRTATIAEWLAHVHSSPPQARAEWADRRLATLPLGARFDSVRISADVLHAALGNIRPAAVGPLVEQLLQGPVIQDADFSFYPLVPVGRVGHWQSRAGEYLGAGGWLGVPQVNQLAPPGTYWVVPMREAGHLCDLRRVAELVAVGAARLAPRAVS